MYLLANDALFFVMGGCDVAGGVGAYGGAWGERASECEGGAF